VAIIIVIMIMIMIIIIIIILLQILWILLHTLRHHAADAILAEAFAAVGTLRECDRGRVALG
jgi:hypothetical protein